jgi:hypothetical protein
MSKNLHQLVPNGIGKVISLGDHVNLKKRLGHLFIDLIKIFGD